MEFHRCDRCGKETESVNDVSFHTFKLGQIDDELCKKCFKLFQIYYSKFKDAKEVVSE